jgi:hypothetical protein
MFTAMLKLDNTQDASRIERVGEVSRHPVICRPLSICRAGTGDRQQHRLLVYSARARDAAPPFLSRERVIGRLR